jgi:hypothetical protein
MPFNPSDRSIADERALLQVLGASRRLASFKALMIRHQRSLRSATGGATFVVPSKWDTPPDAPAVPPASNVRMRTEPPHK